MLTSKFKGLADIALGEAKRRGCTYADIRFTRATNSGVNASGGNRDRDDAGGFGGGGGRGGGAAAAGAAAAASAGGGGGGAHGRRSGAAGFGVRVIHSGIWGFASSPIVTEDEIRAHHAHRHRGRQGERGREENRRQARAGAGLHRTTGRRRSKKDPDDGRRRRQAGLRPEGRRRRRQEQGRQSVNASVQHQHEWKYFAIERGLVHRAGDVRRPRRASTVTARKDGDVTDAQLRRRAEDRRLGSRRSGARCSRTPSASPPRRSSYCTAKPVEHGRQGPRAHAVARDADHPRDRRARDRARSHPRLRGQLRRHQLREARPTSAS